ncbi:MAG: ParB/RepB/Spo0J family partition protein [Treponemataceae bacterium]|nr:ParB/RepB/Spo0J family partition protein [Treponemataceae bacterium]
MAKQFGLGRGLDALLENKDFASPTNEDVPAGGLGAARAAAVPGADFLVDIDKLSPNPHQPRTEFDPEKLQELADSIKEHGVIQPPVVEEAGNGNYWIITGERRTRAAKLAGLTQIPVRVQKYTDVKKLEVALIENIQRQDLNAIEEALAYKELMDLAQITQDDVAKRMGKSRSAVANSLRLLKLPEDMQKKIVSQELTAGHARALLSVTNPSDQRMLFARIMGQNLSVREAEQQAIEMNGGSRAKPEAKPAASAPEKDPNLKTLEEKLIEVLGTKVAIKGSLTKGTIQIEYFNGDDLDRVYNLIVK